MQRNNSTRQESTASPRGSAVGYPLRGLTRIAARWPRFVMATVILASCACAGYAFFFLRFKSDRAQMLERQAELRQHWAAYSKTFDHASDVIVVVESKNLDEIKHAIDDLAERLRREPDNFTSVLARFEAGALQRKWLQYVSPRRLQIGLSRVNQYSPILRGDYRPIELDSLFTQMGDQIESRMEQAADKSLTPAQSAQIFKHAGQLTTSLNDFIANPQDFHTPWPNLVPTDAQTNALRDQTVYLLSDRGTMGYLRVVPRIDAAEESGEWQSLARLEQINAEVAEAHPACQIGLTGVPILEREEMQRSQFDVLLAIAVASVSCLVVMAVGFRGVKHPLLTLVMLAVALTWALGFTTAMIGHLSVLSLAVVVVLFALGLDFAIAYTSRYLQLRGEGWQLRAALMEATGSTGAASLTAAVTTALAFLCTLFADFSGVAELGIIAAAGIMLCALGAFFVLPALISIADENTDSSRLPRPFDGHFVRKGLGRLPLVALVLSVGLVLAVGSQIVKVERRHVAWRLRFDANPLSLHAKNAESVRLERRLYEESSSPLLYAVSVADSERQMRELHAKFIALPSVGHVESLALRLPAGAASDTTRQLLAQYRSSLSYFPSQLPPLRRSDPAVIGKAVENFYQRIKKYPADESAQRVVHATDVFLDRFEKLTLEDQARLLNQFQYRLAADIFQRFQALRYAASDEPIQADDLPNELVSRFVTPTDAEGKRKWLLEIYPQEKAWDGATLAKFVADVRSVDPSVTGAPIHNYESVRQIRHTYETAALYAFAVVWIILLLDFLSREARWLSLLPTLLVGVLAAVMLHARHITVDPMLFTIAYVVVTGAIALVLDARGLLNAALAYLTPLAGGLLMFGVFGLAHIDLNPANLLVLPLVLGIGVNYGMQVMHDYRSRTGPYEMSGSVFNSLVLTAATSIVGFGSMMIASHRGLFSLGLALAIGISSCLFVALVLLPSLLSVISKPAKAASAANSKSESSAPRRVEERRRAA
ncbi:MAG TPA: MMPL family transporter [Planctomycetaceae bacterium]|nr:MMPL family transporter [Planctomycetaceae bacterium]